MRKRVTGIVIAVLVIAGCATGGTQPTAPGTGEEEPEVERYLPRSTPTDPPNELVVMSRPATRRGMEPPPIPGVSAPLSPDAPPPAIMSSPSTAINNNEIRIHVLNIGAGSCHVIECPGSDDVLIADCGSMRPSASDMQRSDVAGFLNDINADGDFIVTISHPHEDHYNRVVALMGDRRPESIWLGGEFNGYGGDGIDRIDTWLDDHSNSGVPIFEGWDAGFANRGEPVNELQCGDAETYILTVNVGSNPNANSMVLLVEFGNFRAIFSGDATGATEKSAMANFGSLINEVSVLLSSHHGAKSHNSNHEDWAEATVPQTVIFSSGLSHKHPKRLAGERYLISVFDDVTEHEMWWDPKSDGSTDTFDTEDAIYATEVSGRVIIDSDGDFFSLTCEKDGTEVECF